MMLNPKRWTTAAVCVTGLLAGEAKAITILGTGVNAEEVAALAGILTQSSSTAITVDNLLTKSQEALKVAQETSSLARKASEVIVDFTYGRSNPNQIFDEATAGFGASFPELDAIANDMEATRANLAGERAGEPRSLMQMMFNARSLSTGTYQTIIAYDNLADGQLFSYMRQAEENARMQGMTTDILNEAFFTDYNAQKAAVLSARAGALSAQAQRETADAALEQTRILQQQYVTARRDRIANELVKEENANDLQAVVPSNETVDGLKMLQELKQNPTVEVVPVVERAR